MNEQTVSPPPLPGEMIRSLVPVLILTGLADFLFWNSMPGLSMSLFGSTVIGLLLFFHRKKDYKNLVVPFLLLAATCVQAAVELNFWTSLWMAGLLIYATSLAYASHRDGLWARWSEGVWAFVKAPFRWFWLLEKAAQTAGGNVGAGLAGLWKGLCIVVPALVLGLVFLLMLSFGNAVMGHGVEEAVSGFFHWIFQDLTVFRLMFWLIAATVLLAAFQPSSPSASPRFWTWQFGKMSVPSDMPVARWRSFAILLVVNILFFTANGIDSIYLWAHASLPDGVGYSHFVHQGVYSLIASVLLAAFVLTALFQQSHDVTRSPGLKFLAHLWIAQNLMLVSGVLFRLKIYVEFFQLSELRIGVALFLLLVSAGFLILCFYVQYEKSFSWLLGRCTLAALVLTFCVQFMDIAGLVASYNVRRWMAGETTKGVYLDSDYLLTLGPSTWPWLQKAAGAGRGWESQKAAELLKKIEWSEGWRSWQWNEIRVRRILEPAAIQADMRQ